MYECIHWLQHNSVHHYSCNTTVCITIHATQQRASLFMQHNSVHHYSCNQKLSAFFSLPSGSSVWSLWPVSMHLKMFGFSTAVLNGVIVLVQNRMPAVQGNLMLLFPNSFSNCGSIWKFSIVFFLFIVSGKESLPIHRHPVIQKNLCQYTDIR